MLGDRPTGPAPVTDIGPHDVVVYQFARMLRGARAPSEVRAALVYLAHRLSGAARVDLELDELPGRAPRLAATWPRAETAAESEAARTHMPPGPSLAFPLQFEGKLRGRLRLYPAEGRRWADADVRRVETLCILAAAAELRSARLDEESATRDPQTGARNAAYLGAFLTHTLARAKRHIEPVTLLVVELDGWRALRERQGDELAIAALSRAARALSGSLRASDLIARLDHDHLVAVLPGCAAGDATRVADMVRSAIAEAELATGLTPAPTASIGVATYPDHALEAGPLLAAAIEALARAQVQGPNLTAGAPRLRPSATSGVALHRVG